MSLDQRFLGTGWAFPPAFDARDRQALKVSHAQDVVESLRILFSTVPGERIMHPSYGCGLKRLVFEHVTESTLTELRSLIEKAVLFFEARITLNAVQIDTEGLPEGVLRLRLDYTLRQTNSRYNLVYPLYLQEASGPVVGRGEAEVAP